MFWINTMFRLNESDHDCERAGGMLDLLVLVSDVCSFGNDTINVLW